MNQNRRFCAGRCLAFVALMAVLIGIVSWAIMSLWNWLLPDLLHAPSISFAQAAGLLILCRLLLGHPFGHRCRGRRWGHCDKNQCDSKEHMNERWQQLPEEERNRLREHMRRWWRC